MLLAGCTGKSTVHSLSDVKNVMTEKYGYEWEELSEHMKKWYCVEEAESMRTKIGNYDKFDSFFVFVFSSDDKASAYLDGYRNDNPDRYLYVNEVGENFVYLDNGYYEDAYGEIYAYRKDNVIFFVTEVYSCWYESAEEAQQLNDSNSNRRNTYLDFCKNELPQIAEALG